MKMKLFISGILFCFLFLVCVEVNAQKNNCIDISETTWQLSYHNKHFGDRNYEIKFSVDGKLLNSHPNESTKDNDKWIQKQNHITLSFNDGYAVYKGKIVDSKTIKGTAKSLSGGRWKWKAIKLY